ncbi:MAG: hypothetical protein ACYST2_05905, partial [Planctomycetota bacterium]
NTAKDLGLAVRGLFGEGTDASGDFYQLSNQTTLGISEEKIIEKFEKQIIPEIVEYEITARRELLDKKKDTLDDKISRATALLKNAHLISSQEALFLLSHLRLGVNMRDYMGISTPAIEKLCSMAGLESGRSGENQKHMSIRTINRLFMLTLPAHLQINHGKILDPGHRDALRARIIREELNQKNS